MKYLLTCIGIFLSVFTFSQEEEIVYIPDPILKNYLVTQATINTNGDDEIQVSEAVAFNGHIGLGNPSGYNDLIMDLSGIEAFVNVATITFVHQGLTTLDLSQNTLLTRAIFTSNNLTSVSLGNNLVLENLILDSNNLTEIDLSGHAALEYLNLNDNENLIQVNLTNGNNANMLHVNFRFVPNLTCVQIDPGFVVPPSGGNGNHRWFYDDESIFSEDCWQENLDVAEQKEKIASLQIYPNPATDVLNISGNEVQNVKVFNVLGQQMKVTHSNNTVDVQRLAPGTYVMQAEDNEGNVQNIKFIKK